MYIFATISQVSILNVHCKVKTFPTVWINVELLLFKVDHFFGPLVPSSFQVLKEISGQSHFSPAMDWIKIDIWPR